MKAFRPVLFLVLIMLVVGLACSTVTGGRDVPTQPVATQEPVQPVNPPTATTAPEPTEAPTEAAPPTESAPEARDFYTEEFESEYAPDNWQTFTLGKGEDDKLVIQQEDDHLLFDLGDEDLYVYYMYTPYTYENVSVRLNAQNRGRNNNNVSLICRMNEDGSKWYEFSVESGGVWYLYAVDGGYNRIANGGVNSLRQGKEENTYRMDCVDNEITMYVNDKKLTTFKDNKYLFNDGYVGFNISSLNVLPITVEVNWFEITQPE